MSSTVTAKVIQGSTGREGNFDPGPQQCTVDKQAQVYFDRKTINIVKESNLLMTVSSIFPIIPTS
jgi:hypothetical protein